MGFFGGRGRGKGRNGRQNRGAQPYNAVPQGVSHGHHKPGGGKKSRTCNPKVACFAVLVWMAVVVMSGLLFPKYSRNPRWIGAYLTPVITLVGCMSKSPGIDQLYLVELRHNTSYEFRFGIGYFGGCISTTSLDESASSSSTHCVDNLRASDFDDLTETFLENLPSAGDLAPVLNTTLPLARDLQTNVFFFPLPPIHLFLFGLSGIILLFGLGGKARSRAYHLGIIVAAVLGALATTTAFVMCIGSLQAMNALELLIGGDNTNASSDANLIADPVRIDIGNGIKLHGAHRLAHVQYALAAFTMLFYVLLGAMYAKRKPDEPIVVMGANPMWWARR